jgi:hypothetical protein
MGKRLTLYDIGHGISIGGIIMLIIAGLSFFGYSGASEIDMKNNYIRSSSGISFDKLSKEFMQSKDKNMNFTVFITLSSIPSIIIGYLMTL